MKAKVVIGYDGSPQAGDALALGRRLAELLDASVLLATVIEPAHHGMDDQEFQAAVGEFSEGLYSPARERLGGLEVSERPIVDGSCSAAFYGLADWEKPALTVIGSTHLARVGRVVAGSLGISLLSGLPCPVAVAPRGYADGEFDLKRVGVGIDGSSESWRALKAAVVLGTRLGAPVELITVVPPPHYVVGGLLSPLNREQYGEFKQREAEGLLQEAIRRIPDELFAEQRVLHGNAAESLAEAGERLDLILVGSRAHGPVAGALLGSVSAKLMSTAPCPVMVLARGAGARPLDPGR